MPNCIVGIDLGNSSLKAVRLQRQQNQYVLSRVASLPVTRDPANTAALPTEQAIAAQLREIAGLVKASGADVHFTINSLNSALRYVELPQIPLDEIRSALKLNSTTYLRQNFENFTFDACPLDPEAREILLNKKSKKEAAAATHGKIKILAGGISSAEAVLYYHAARRAGIKPRSLQLAPISLINGFQAAYPEIFSQEAVALLDFGFLSSSLTILDKGKPLLTRSVPMGGKHITDYIAQMSNMDFAKAETAKLQGEVPLDEAVSRTGDTLIREVRSSINFFEKNSDQAISKVYLAGASAISTVLMETLSKDIGTACETWKASQGLLSQLPPEQQNLFARNEFAFSTALGAARTYSVKIEASPSVAKKASVVVPPSKSASTVLPPST